MTIIRHRLDDAPPFLEMSYTYDPRGLITQVVETDEFAVPTVVTYTYDARGRLTHETRLAPPPNAPSNYDLEYTYDQGGNRLTKIDLQAGRQTIYHYDLENPALYGHAANRLMSYEVFAAGVLLERVEYGYALDGDAAGNVTQIAHQTPDPLDPLLFSVSATCFTYNKVAEVWLVTQREWYEFNGAQVTSTVTTGIREYRGNGRTRTMMRQRHVATGAVLPESAVWTDYDGQSPTADYTVDAFDPGPDPAVTEVRRYGLGLVQVESDFTASYFHGDHLGTTRALTDPAGMASRAVYTAFGERVSTTGPGDTRYQYVGYHGYESFADLPYLHVGVRWYYPETGRFLQRDPIGILGGFNLYMYVGNSATRFVDPSGKGSWEDIVWEITGGSNPNWLGGYLDGHSEGEIQETADMFHRIGATGLEIAAGLRITACLSRVPALGFLNHNRYVRIGKGWWPDAGKKVTRIAIGGKNAIIHGHLDLRFLGW